MAERPNLLVTDFDGTLTQRDFFRLVVEAFAPAHLDEYWRGYQEGVLTHFEALAGIFAGIRASEAEMDALLARAGPDPDLAAWIARLHASGWEVVVASAGCEWYIRRILSRCGVDIPIHANPGSFTPEGGLRMRLPRHSPYLCPSLGIDKAALVQEGLDAGRIVAFAGDGYPDLAAARRVPLQLRFARDDLAVALEREGLAYRNFSRWSEVAEALCARI